MLPTKDEISRAIEDVNNISIPQLHGYQPCEGIIGPESYAGGFCIVFPFTNGYDKKAVRVWHQEIDRGQDRYSCIANDFSKTSSRFLCDLRYYPSSLSVFNNKVDVVVMDWVKGKPLKEYIQSIIDNGNDTSVLLSDLAEEAKNMFRELHSLNFSHGDLQHDNLIITEYGRIKLVDYDSFYTPSLASGFRQTTTGYNGYQHPSRFLGNIDSNERIDYFSELIIYLSLRALANDISLWNFAKDSDYSFLFDSGDFQNIEKSPLYNSIYSMGEEMQILLRILKEYLEETDINNLECFEELYNRYVTPPTIKLFNHSRDSSIYIDDEIELKWDVEAYSKLTVNGKDVTNKKSYKLKASTITQFELVASNGIKEARSNLFIDIFKNPTVKFKASKTKLRQGGNEGVRFTWIIQDAVSAKLFANEEQCEEIGLTGEKTFTPNVDTVYKLVVVGNDGNRTFEKSLPIKVIPEAEVELYVSKKFTIPGVPVIATWSVKNAVNVTLKVEAETNYSKNVPFEGQYEILVENPTVVSLDVEDAFGTKTVRQVINMLPLPVMKLHASPPVINSSISLSQKVTPLDIAFCKTPELPNVQVKAPFIKTVKLNFELPHFIDLKLPKITLWGRIKNAFNRAFTKLITT